ncbi:MAG: methylated-DNA--[protein]-cysteine S-methyltransferase [Candidatus Zixiibacteriota bacterium]
MKRKRGSNADSGEQALYVHQVESVLGRIELAQTDRGVCRIRLPGERGSLLDELVESADTDFEALFGGPENLRAARQLKEYLAGKRKRFDFKLDIQASGFKRRALVDGVMKIPYGQTRSYSDVARSIGSPRACRAVGNANATNPLPFVIPCHRVVAAHGIGGYGGGLELKKTLLDLEARNSGRASRSQRR